MQQMIASAGAAPSRLTYRIQRLMLSPLHRTLLIAGLPILLLLAALAAGLHGERRSSLAEAWAEAWRAVETRPELMIGSIEVSGAGAALEEEIRSMLPVELPVSALALDLGALHGRIVGLSSVAEAGVRIRSGGALEVTVLEREPAVVWRTRYRLALLDASGVGLEGLDSRRQRLDLPLVAGAGADEAVSEALALFGAAEPLGAPVAGLVRVGERRWDLVLASGLRILLPERDPVAALAEVIRMDRSGGLLSRDLRTIDMRLPQRPTARMGAAGAERLWGAGAAQGEG